MRDVTVTRVELSGDLREATVWFTPLGALGDEQRIAELTAGLKKAAPFLQGRAGRALSLRNTPRLRFRYDSGVANLVHMHEVMATLDTGPAEPETPAEDTEVDDG